jgi:hypothetical protein
MKHCVKCNIELGQRGEKGTLLKDKNICCYCWIKQDKEKNNASKLR